MLPTIQNQKSKVGFYFHIPFCPHICPYCDFIKTSQFSVKDVHAYFKEIYLSLNLILEEFADNPYICESTHCTVYFGGGTPSLFEAKFYAPILERLSQTFILEEVTIETNPFTNKQNFISGYKDIGIHRVTLGAQSLCDKTLQFLGRKHSKKDVLKNIEWLRNVGINQIQVDLIYGLKLERTIPIEEEIKTLISVGATGISAYGLTVESRTIFAKSTHQVIDESKAIQEYESILKVCANLGLKQLESSNFSFFDAKHNQIYWHGYPYFGIGTGAHGLLPSTEKLPYGIRYKVGLPTPERAPGDDLLKFNASQHISQNFERIFEPKRTQTNMIEELIFTLLRTENGIPFDWLTKMWSHDAHIRLSGQNFLSTEPKSKILSHPQIKRAINEGKIKISENYISLSPNEKIRGDAWALIFISSIL